MEERLLNYLFYLRKSRGLGIVQASELTGVDQATLSKAERGKLYRQPKKMLARLQKLYGPGWTWETLMMPVRVIYPAGVYATEATETTTTTEQ